MDLELLTLVDGLDNLEDRLQRGLRKHRLRKLKTPVTKTFTKQTVKPLPVLSTGYSHKHKLVISSQLPLLSLNPRIEHDYLPVGYTPGVPADPDVNYHEAITSQIPVQEQGSFVYIPDTDAIISAYHFMHEFIESACSNGTRDIFLGGSNQVKDYTFRGYWTHVLNDLGGPVTGRKFFDQMFYMQAQKLTNMRVDLAASDDWILEYVQDVMDSVTEDFPGYKLERELKGF